MDIAYLLSGFRKVTKEEFYARIGPENIHPSVRDVAYSDPCSGADWKNQRTGQIVGRSVSVSRVGYPHWKPDTDYYLLESA